MEKGPEIWFNGRFYEGDPPVGGLFYHGLHYGTAAWEGIRRIGNNLLKLSNHVARLNFGSDSLGIGWPFKEDDFSQVILETASRNPEKNFKAWKNTAKPFCSSHCCFTAHKNKTCIYTA